MRKRCELAVDVPPLRWLASVLYAAVLLTGIYYAAAGLAPGWSAAALAGFVAGLLALLVVEQVDRRRAAGQASRGRAVTLLVLRILLVAAVNAADIPGFARALYVLVPFFAYLSLGRRAGLGLAVAYLVVATTGAAFTPGWYADPELVSDLLMLFIGIRPAARRPPHPAGRSPTASTTPDSGSRSR